MSDLEIMEQKYRRAVLALRELHDYQNGCPLPKYREGWHRAMAEAKIVLEEFEESLPSIEDVRGIYNRPENLIPRKTEQ